MTNRLSSAEGLCDRAMDVLSRMPENCDRNAQIYTRFSRIKLMETFVKKHEWMEMEKSLCQAEELCDVALRWASQSQLRRRTTQLKLERTFISARRAEFAFKTGKNVSQACDSRHQTILDIAAALEDQRIADPGSILQMEAMANWWRKRLWRIDHPN